MGPGVEVNGRLIWNPQAIEANTRTRKMGSILRIIIFSYLLNNK
jgi:hypothetical protein